LLQHQAVEIATVVSYFETAGKLEEFGSHFDSFFDAKMSLIVFLFGSISQWNNTLDWLIDKCERTEVVLFTSVSIRATKGVDLYDKLFKVEIKCGGAKRG
jgi:hypothetical protein